MWCPLRFVLCCCLLVLPSVAAANEYFPLERGMTWNYISDEGHLRGVVGDELVVRYRTTVVVDWYRDGYLAQEYHNCWSKSDGDWILLHAAWNDDGFSVAYEPPIRWLPASLVVGDHWDASYDFFFDWEDFYPDGHFSSQRGVLREEDWKILAGDFHAYLVTDYSRGATLPDGQHDLLGRRVAGGKDTGYLHWYAIGVGKIIHERFVLESMPVAAERRTWGAIKDLYR